MTRLVRSRGSVACPRDCPRRELIFAAVRFRRSAAAPATDAGQPPPAAASRESGGIVCFGTVDLEHGVAALTSTQPGRVAEVLVAENQQVAQGAECCAWKMPSPAAGSPRRRRPSSWPACNGNMPGSSPISTASGSPSSRRCAAMHSRVEAARRVLEREQRLAKSAIITDSDRSINLEKIREVEATKRAEVQRLAELEAQDVGVEIDRAESELKAAEARLEQARLALEECRLKAPRPGTVLRILVGPGDVLGSQPAVLFAADGPQVIRATVEQEFAGRVKEGEPAQVRDDADPSTTLHGRVGRVAGWYSQRRTILHDPSQLSDVRTLECLIVLEPGQSRLRLGQSVRIFIGPASP